MRLAWVFMTVGCAQQAIPNVEPESVEGALQWGPSSVYEEDLQCRDLLGSIADSLTNRTAGQPYVSFPLETTAGQAVSITAAGLSIPGTTLLNKQLKTGTNGVSVKVVGVGGNPSDPAGLAYLLKYRTAADPTWRDYCEPNETATALRGEWKASAFRLSTDRVTFGCTGSALRKCYDFGYPAPPDDSAANLTAFRAHQACTRMARADIFGTGTANTRRLTPIVIRDLLEGHNPEPIPPAGSEVAPLLEAPFPTPPDRHYYEAAWTWKEDWGAVCLERDRWHSIGEPLSANPPDPRVAAAEFCSELSEDALRDRGAVLVNASKTQDRIIKLWRNPATGDVVSTIRGFWRGDHADPEPFPGEGYTEYLGIDGILLRNPPYSLTPADVVPVYGLIVGPNDRALVPDPNRTPTDPTFEGYMLKQRPGALVRFRKFTRVRADGTTDTVTSVGRPVAEGWQEAGALEYVLSIPNGEL